MTLQFKTPATAPAPKPANLDWKTLDPATLPEDLRKLYDAWREADAIAKAAKKLFTDECREAIVAPAGTSFVLGFLYGKLSYAFAPLKTTKAQANAVDFRTLLK